MMQIIVALCAGLILAGGYFAVVTSIGVITRFGDNTRTASKMRIYEVCIAVGAILGCIIIVFEPHICGVGWAYIIWAVFGGMYVGCFILALSEAVRGIPILFRRSGLKKGFSTIVLSYALGKAIGSLLYFLL